MLQYAIFSLLLGFGFVDLFFLNSHYYILVFVYASLRIHSEMAATKFLLKSYLSGPAEITPEPEDYFAQIKIPKKLLADAQPAPQEELEKTKEMPAPEPKKPAKPKGLFLTPNFQGPAHEVLGIEPEADTKIIHLAFRHWIKKYHPDHQRAEVCDKATQQARRLQEAKLAMLEKRLRNHSRNNKAAA